MMNQQTVLITGGTGSFGNKLVEIALERFQPKRIIVFSRDELKQHEMRLRFPDSRLSFFLGDVRDKDRLLRALEANVDLVIHAAALKQVPSCEYNPFEAIKTNILGAQNVIEAAIDTGIPKVLALSTDKAVNPVNMYGATKLCAERLFVQGNAYVGRRNTVLSCVRYGNVIASRGSVVPIFQRQRPSGVLTVTDKRMTRFWMTLEQAVEFVAFCVRIMKGGEVFVPRIPSMKVIDLARALAPECSIRFTGVRPGEKLHETLISSDEARHTVRLENMYIIQPEYRFWSKEQNLGQPVSEGFCLSSDRNEAWLEPFQLQEWIGENSNGQLRQQAGS